MRGLRGRLPAAGAVRRQPPAAQRRLHDGRAGLVRGRHRPGRHRLRSRRRSPRRLLFHAPKHRLRRRPVRLRRRRPTRPPLAAKRWSQVGFHEPALQAAQGRQVPGREPRLRPRLRRLEHGRGHRRREQRRQTRRTHHPVRRRQALPQQWRRHVHGRDGRFRPQSSSFGAFPPRSWTTTTTACSTSSSSTTWTTIRPGCASRRATRGAIIARRTSFPARSPSCSTTSAKPGGKPLKDVTESSSWEKRRPRPRRRLHRLRRRRLARHFRGQRRSRRTACGSTSTTARSRKRRSSAASAYDGMGKAQSGMGVAFGDIDGDGLEDVFVTHLGAETNTLWMQGPRGLFRDRTGPSGLAAPQSRGTGWGTVLADFNLDGALDLAVVNGRVARGEALPGSAAARQVLVGLRGAESAVRRRRQGPLPRPVARPVGTVRNAERGPRPGRRRREQRRGAGPAGDDGGRQGAAAPQPGARPRPLADRPGLVPSQTTPQRVARPSAPRSS